MEKLFIKNRHDKKISVTVEETDKPKGLAFVMHGLGATKNQTSKKVMVDSFKEHGYTVVRFDTTNTFGESDGDYAKATLTNYYQDLEDVIKWASEQPWYQEPFVLAARSLGSISIVLYTIKYSDKVKALAPTSCIVTGSVINKRYEGSSRENWEASGWEVEPGFDKPDFINRLDWENFSSDLVKYDILPEAHKIAQPVLLVVGDNDLVTTPEDQKLFYEKLQGDRELHILENCGHSFKEHFSLEEFKNIFDKWLKEKVK